MARIVLVKDIDGELHGYTDADERAYHRFAQIVDELAEGETLAFSWREPRTPEFHRAHFALLKLIFESQETFAHADQLRAWLTCGAGHCDYVAGPGGELVAIPRSIAYETLDETDFREHHKRVIDFLRTPRAYHFLWPALTDIQGADAAAQLIAHYEAQRIHGTSDDEAGDTPID
jgi:Protein of unknown function (DUF1367)